MLKSGHINCVPCFYLIMMYVERDGPIYIWHPNERWKEANEYEPSLWTRGEATREWSRATRSLARYRDHTTIELCSVHDLCGLHQVIRSLHIERSDDA